MGKLINIDNGGTLTDFCLFDGERLLFTKTLTTPHDLSTCFFDGLQRLSALTYGEEDVARLLQDTDYIRYSTTQGTNALVQRRGPRLGLITSSDAAVEALRRDRRTSDLFESLFADRVGVIDLAGDDETLDRILTQVVNDLSASGANRLVVSIDSEDARALENRFERIILRRFPSHLLGALPISFAASMGQDPDFSRRSWTAIFNAFLHPAMEQFLYGAEHRLKAHRTRNPLLIFRNDGGSARVAKTIALKTYSSGPRGGIEGAKALASHYGFEQLLSIDVGGTTTDIGLVRSGAVRQTQYGKVEGVTVSVPLCQIHSEGVGGSSVIAADGKNITVGPTSVGAAPGPACFGRGGTDLTITDVALLNGVIDPSTYFGGQLALDANRAENALTTAISEPLALTIEQAMEAAESAWVSQVVVGVKKISIESGEKILAGFGGGGPMFLTTLAQAIGLTKAIIPAMASVFSAYGIGFSDLSQHYQVHINAGVGDAIDPELEVAADALLVRARRDMFAENISLDDCELKWSIVDASESAGDVNESINTALAAGWSPGTPIPSDLSTPLILRLEAVKLIDRLSFSTAPRPAEFAADTGHTRTIQQRGATLAVPLYIFSELQPGASASGPCIIEDDFFTARIDAGWQFSLTANRDILLEFT